MPNPQRDKLIAHATLVVLALLPGLYAGLMTWANQDPMHHLNQIPAALVNLDQPQSPGPGGQPLAIGATVSGQLVDSDNSSTFDWAETTADDAAQGLLDGAYYAILTIPADFSANVGALLTGRPDAQATHLTLVTDDSINQIVGNFATSMGLTMADTLSDTVTQQYLGAFTQTVAANPAAAAGLAPVAAVVAHPVEVDVSRLNPLPAYGYGLAPYFMSLSLWVAGLAFYSTVSPFSPRALNPQLPLWKGALRSYGRGGVVAVVGSIAMVLALHYLVGIHAANPWGLAALAALIGLSFMAFIQGLVAALGPLGRFLGLVLLILQVSAAGGTYPVQTAPHFYRVIHPYLPLSHTTEAMRSLVGGGRLGIATATWIVAGCFAAGLALIMVGLRRQRRKRARIEVPADVEGQAIGA